jgi:amino acid transporter
VLTVAVSVSSGVAQLVSAYPDLYGLRVEIAVVCVFVIMLANLRGLRETGTLMTVPVYLFLFTYIPMLVYGGVRLFLDCPTPLETVAPQPVHPLTLFLILHTFATGCTALTGIEAISNGVPAFQRPESRRMLDVR